MDDLRERLRSLDQLEPPDLRRRLGIHSMPPPRERRSARLLAAAAVLLVAAAAIAAAFVAFRGTARPAAPSVAPTLRPNGPIWFLGGDQPGSIFGPSSVSSIDEDGSGRSTLNISNRLHSITGLAVSPNGLLIAVSNGGGEFPPRNIFVMQSDGSGLRQITSGEFQEVDPAWAPDGSRIVFSSTRCCASDRSQSNYDLYTIRPDGSDLRHLISDSASDLSPAWSPDGSRIAYVRYEEGDRGWQIWTVSADGTDAGRVVDNDRYNSVVAWSPDGDELAYVTELGDRDYQIRVVRADGTHERTLFECSEPCIATGYTLAWSPDGTEIAFTQFFKSPGHAKQKISLIPSSGGEVRIVETTGTSACCLSWVPKNPSGP